MSDKPQANLTSQEVLDYFAKEYSDDGKLMVYSCPESLEQYIEWWWHGGSSRISDFACELAIYLKQNGYDYRYKEMEVESLKELLPLVRG